MAVQNDSRAIEAHSKKLAQFVAAHADLDGVDVRIYVYLTSVLNFDEFIHVQQIEIAVALKRNRSHVSRSIKRLTELGIIEHSEKGARASEWRLSSKLPGKRKKA